MNNEPVWRTAYMAALVGLVCGVAAFLIFQLVAFTALFVTEDFLLYNIALDTANIFAAVVGLTMALISFLMFRSS